MKKKKLLLLLGALGCFAWIINMKGQDQQFKFNPYEFWPVKTSQNMVRVLDSITYYSFNTSTLGWDKLYKNAVISRHWGTEGWPHEFIWYSFNPTSLTWEPKEYADIQYFPNHQIKSMMVKKFNSFIEQFRDTINYKLFSPKVDQWGDSITIIYHYANYNQTTNSIDFGYKLLSTMRNDSQIAQIIEKNYNPATGHYDINASYLIYEYNDQNLISYILKLVWDNTEQQYINDYRTYYLYYPDRMLKSAIKQYFSGGIWHNGVKYEKTYTPNKLLKTYITYYPNSSEEFVYDRKDTFIYTYSNKLNKYIRYLWNPSTNSWNNSYRTTITYNAQDLDIQYLEEYWDGTSWVNNYKNEKTYNARGKVLTLNDYLYNSSTSSWENYYRETYQYDPTDTNVIEIISYWGNPLQAQYKYTYTYDAYGKETSQTYYSWDNATSSWQPYYKELNHWSDWDANGIQDLLSLSFNVYPNPCQDELQVSVNTPVKTVEVFDVFGRKIISHELSPTENFSLNVSQLANGFYQLQVTNNHGNKFQKSFIKTR